MERTLIIRCDPHRHERRERRCAIFLRSQSRAHATTLTRQTKARLSLTRPSFAHLDAARRFRLSVAVDRPQQLLSSAEDGRGGDTTATEVIRRASPTRRHKRVHGQRGRGREREREREGGREGGRERERKKRWGMEMERKDVLTEREGEYTHTRTHTNK